MEESKKHPETPEVGNVFQILTQHIPQSKFQATVDQFRQLEEQFTDYLESNCNHEDFFPQSSTLPDISSDYFTLIQDPQTNQRSLISTKLIPKSTLILEQDPLVSLLALDKLPKLCAFCFKKAKSLCTQCKTLSYCSQDCQRKDWPRHKSECTTLKTKLKQVPHALWMLWQMLQLKLDQGNKEFMRNLQRYNKIISMISNANRGIMSEEKKEEVMNYAMITFLQSGMEVNMENFKVITHLYFISLCNGFGIADEQLLRIGTGIYFPSNYLNHSCEPNCIALFRGNRQFIVTIRDILPDEELTLCYIDNGIQDYNERQSILRDQYYFTCLCTRCEKDMKNTLLKPQSKDVSDQTIQLLDLQALELEQAGKYQESLTLLDKLLQLQPGQNLKKSILERAAFIAIVLKNYQIAVEYQKELCKVSEELYLQDKDTTLSHPLLGFHYYQYGKLLSQINEYYNAASYLHKATTILSAYYSIKSGVDGKMINEKLIHEVNENYLANVQLMNERGQQRQQTAIEE